MIQTVSQLPELRERIAQWKRAGEHIGFVPTMGNLHAGHLALVRQARANADRVVTSIFVNPTQFGPNEDFAQYPRTIEADTERLDAGGCDLLWLPSVATMYPFGAEATVRISVPGLSDSLEGVHRPGHLDGVATVVARLLNQVQADVAVFGCKDYQQLAVVRYLVRDLAFPVEIIGAPTMREADGLAMSSRNQYLTPAQRPAAAAIFECLRWMRAAVQEGVACAEVEASAAERLQAAGFVLDYAVVRRRDLGLPAERERGDLVALVAVRLGRTRLIDNLEFEA
ncbi:MAG: pantoate--beta-alanine ligase [Pseudomonadota bacterium]|nr:pantoate--beta-alanine ligase [Pseudomonadota bacterium]